MILIGAVALLPFALADFRVEPAAWPFIAVSAVFELAYFALLSAAYARAPAGVVYPLARGSAPVFVLFVSVAFLGGRFDLLSIAGIINPCCHRYSVVVLPSGSLRRRPSQ